MSDASTHDDEPTDDPDRAAIFARRQRFIAIALGMLGVAACHKPGPQACLSVAPSEPPPTEESPPETPPTDDTPEKPPEIPPSPAQP